MMKEKAAARRIGQDPVLRGILPALCLILAVFAFASQPPKELFVGFWRILISDAGLITDPAVVGGAGAALLNAALVLALSTALVYGMGLPVTGLTFACLFMMAGFSLLGKNLLNILPVLLGGWLYAKFQGESFSKYVYQTLFSTCLSPLVSFWLVHLPSPWCWAAMLGSGIAIGFFVPAVAGYTVRVHQGFDLYNVGFAAGFIGLAIASICKGLGVEFVTELHWGFEDHKTFLWLLRVILLGLLFSGVYLGCRRWRDYAPLLRHSGRSVADFILMDGAAPTLVNMAFTGAIGLVYLLGLYPFGVRLNGPLVCCVLSMTGFAAFGKHPKNILPVMAGAALAKALLVAVPFTAPGPLLAVLFCTGLAPIAGQYGVFWGMAAGFLHMTIVQNTSILHGGMNLYNNGFAAGLVCIILLPIIEAFKRHTKD